VNTLAQMPFDRARAEEQLRADDDPIGFEIFDSVVASIGLTLADEAWHTRPFRADTARTARDAIDPAT
jgi:hypothetical protein